jgi:hypothetical protein
LDLKEQHILEILLLLAQLLVIRGGTIMMVSVMFTTLMLTPLNGFRNPQLVLWDILVQQEPLAVMVTQDLLA